MPVDEPDLEYEYMETFGIDRATSAYMMRMMRRAAEESTRARMEEKAEPEKKPPFWLPPIEVFLLMPYEDIEELVLDQADREDASDYKHVSEYTSDRSVLVMSLMKITSSACEADYDDPTRYDNHFSSWMVRR